MNGALNAAVLASQILSLSDDAVKARVSEYKRNLTKKIVKANEELHEVKYNFKTN